MRLIAAISLLLVMADAHAYLDPGTGAMMLQVILGGIAAIGVAVKLYWHKLLEIFGVRQKPDDEVGDEDSDEDSDEASDEVGDSDSDQIDDGTER